MAFSMVAYCWWRSRPVKSNAPAFTSASMTFRLALRESTRSQKSKRSLKGRSLRASRMASMAPSPTPLMAPSPKRIFPSTAPKARSDRFASGGSTSCPAARASAMWSTTLSVLSFSLVSSAAMNSTGWWALSHAVWRVMRP